MKYVFSYFVYVLSRPVQADLQSGCIEYKHL
jgi:hypothetical protein